MKRVLRDTTTTSDFSSPSPNPNSHKQRSSSSSTTPRKKFNNENAPPPHTDTNTLLDPSPSMPSSKSKIKSPLPPRPPSSNTNPLKRKLVMESVPENSVSGSSDSGVKVIVRMRPPIKDDEGDLIIQKVTGDSLAVLGQTFTFDSVADTESSQQDIFQLVGGPLVENCLAGFNSSIFAYGQTGSGKTYTMWGPANALLDEDLSSSQRGLTPRVFEKLFSRIDEEQAKHADKQLQYQCRCSFLEIYNEQITDLLDPTQGNLPIREDVKSGVYVENLTEEYVCSMKDVIQILLKGLSNRRTGATIINAESSRSHCVFTCVVESQCKSMADGLSSIRISRINLVDLAGSERQKLTGAAGERLKEAGNINRSLSQLGNLINILAEVSQSGKQRHIPYRDSRLTFLLQESLGGNAKLAMICAISPAQSCKSETLSTLRFAQRAKAIKNKAVVNEVTQEDVKVLREVIRQLKDELLRMKENGNPNSNGGGYSTSWNARRSLNLLKLSLNRPMTLAHIEEDSDEEMEIDEEAVERLGARVGLQQLSCEEDTSHEGSKLQRIQSQSEVVSCRSADCDDQHSKDTHVIMEGFQQVASEDVGKHGGCIEPALNDQNCSTLDGFNHQNLEKHTDNGNVTHKSADLLNGLSARESSAHKSADLLNSVSAGEPMMDNLITVDCRASNSVSVAEKLSELVQCGSEVSTVASLLPNPPSTSPNCALPSVRGVESAEVSPILHSPTLSVSPTVSNSSRKSLKTSSMLSASEKDLGRERHIEEALHLSFAKPLKNHSINAYSTKNSLPSTEHLAVSLHRGLQIIDSHRQSSVLRRSSFRFSYNPVNFKSPVHKVDVGVQTLLQDAEESKEYPSPFLCSECKSRADQTELSEVNDKLDMQLVPRADQTELSEVYDKLDMQLVPVDESSSAEKSKKQVPKAVKKVLAGAIRREMALEDLCAKQNSEIVQLNRLIMQYKHERECNVIIGQTREDKIIRLESLMDGVLPTEEFMEEEFVSLVNEHKILKEKYENHPEVLRAKIDLKRVQDELDSYRNFFDMGERDVLIEEIHNLRSQLPYYIDSPSPMSARKRSPVLQLTQAGEPSSAGLSTIPESTVESVEHKFEQERLRWIEAESNWISLSEELRSELDTNRSLAANLRKELESEKKCSEELKEALQMAMQGHARMLEQYADLEEKHMELLARHRKMQEGIEDVKRAAAKAGVKGAESRFINSLAAEISALRVGREKERRYFMDENKGLQAQLKDTAEAVQAAGELLVRLKEAEEAADNAQKRALVAEQEADKAYKQIDSLKKKHEKEITSFNHLLAESRLPKEALLRPACDDFDTVKFGVGEGHNSANEQWRDEFEPFYHGDDGELSKLTEPSSWFSGYDRCNI